MKSANWIAPTLLVATMSCGRIGFENRADDEEAIDASLAALFDAKVVDLDAAATPDADTTDANNATIIAIAGAGIWGPNSQLRRDLATSTSTRRYTFATWSRSDNIDTMMLGAGVNFDEQSFIWVGSDDGRPFFQHQAAATGFYAHGPDTGGNWLHNAAWYHLVVSVDMDAATLEDRIRFWINGIPMPRVDIGNVFPQGLDLYLGAAVRHTLGNKYDGAFDWSGMLAETYIIWGENLDASAFVKFDDLGELRSVEYTGPVSAESVYFDYATAAPGQNAFAAQPDWTATNMTRTSASSQLPY